MCIWKTSFIRVRIFLFVYQKNKGRCVNFELLSSTGTFWNTATAGLEAVGCWSCPAPKCWPLSMVNWAASTVPSQVLLPTALQFLRGENWTRLLTFDNSSGRWHLSPGLFCVSMCLSLCSARAAAVTAELSEPSRNCRGRKLGCFLFY